MIMKMEMRPVLVNDVSARTFGSIPFCIHVRWAGSLDSQMAFTSKESSGIEEGMSNVLSEKVASLPDEERLTTVSGLFWSIHALV